MTQEGVILAIAILLLFVATMFLFIGRVRAGQLPNLRRIQAYEDLKLLASRAIEAGRPLHLSLGTGSLADQSSADSLAGLAVLEHLAKQAAVTRVPPTVSMADPTVMLFAQNALRAAYGEDKRGAEMAYRQVRWIAPQPGAYAAGTMSLLNVDKPGANIMIGKFGDEYLLMGETAARRGIAHIGGASNPNTLPLVYVSADETLLGEEMFAAGAYLQKHPAHIASLLAQDTMRWILFLLITAGVILTTLGLWNNG